MNMTRSFFFRALTGTAALLAFAACGGGGGGGGGSSSGGGSSTPWTEDYSQHPGITDPGQVDPNADSPLVGITMTITDTVGTEVTRKDVLKFEQNGGGSISITKKDYEGERTYSGSINTYTYTRISAGQAQLHVEAGWTETGWPAGDSDEETRDYVINFTSAIKGTIGINAPGSTPVSFEKATTIP